MEHLNKYLNRARSAIGHEIRYGLGKGGNNPQSPLPDDGTGRCDCSGFVAWVLGMSRKPKITRRWWIETTNIYRDATGPQKVFQRIKKAVPGCVIVFPDTNGHEGHVGIVSAVNEWGDATMVVDCAKRGITEQSDKYFERNHAIYCMLKQDVR